MQPPRLSLEFDHRSTLTYSLASHPAWNWFFTDSNLPGDTPPLPDLPTSYEEGPTSWAHALAELRRSSGSNTGTSTTTATPVPPSPAPAAGNTIWPEPFQKRNALSKPLYRLFANYEAKLRGKQPPSKGRFKPKPSPSQPKSTPDQRGNKGQKNTNKTQSKVKPKGHNQNQPPKPPKQIPNKPKPRSKPTGHHQNAPPSPPNRRNRSDHPKIKIESKEWGHIVPDWRSHVKFDDKGKAVRVNDWLPLVERCGGEDGGVELQSVGRGGDEVKDERLKSPTPPPEHPATIKDERLNSKPRLNGASTTPDQGLTTHPRPGIQVQPPESPHASYPRPPHATKLGRMVISSAATGHIVPCSERRHIRFENETDDDVFEAVDVAWSDAGATEGGETNSFYYSSSSSSGSSSLSGAGDSSYDGDDSDESSSDSDSDSDDTTEELVSSRVGSESSNFSDTSGSDEEVQTPSTDSDDDDDDDADADADADADSEWSWQEIEEEMIDRAARRFGAQMDADAMSLSFEEEMAAASAAMRSAENDDDETMAAEADALNEDTFENLDLPPPQPRPRQQAPPQSRFGSVLASISAHIFGGGVRADEDGEVPPMVEDEGDEYDSDDEWVQVGYRSDNE